MLIGICDDNIAYLEEAKQTIGGFFHEKGLFNSVSVFSTSAELQNFINSSSAPLDLLFMDIDMPDTNGITLAKDINQKFPVCKLVYLTNYLDFAPDVYETNHFYFIIKEQLSYRLPALYEKLSASSFDDVSAYISIAGLHNAQYHVLVNDIIHIERMKRISHIHTQDFPIQTKIKLEELLSLLNEHSFIRTHQSYIVALASIRELHKTDIILQNGQNIPISRAYQKSVKEAYLRWITSKL